MHGAVSRCGLVPLGIEPPSSSNHGIVNQISLRHSNVSALDIICKSLYFKYVKDVISIL